MGDNNTVIYNNQQNDIKQLRDLISDFVNTQNVNNGELKDVLQSIIEDIDGGKTGEKQVGGWWNRLSKISDIVTIGTTVCNLLPVAHKMPKGRHSGAGSDTMQQVHGAGVKSNYIKLQKGLKYKRGLET